MTAFSMKLGSLVSLAAPWVIACAPAASQMRPAGQTASAPAAHETHGAHHHDEHAAASTSPVASPAPAAGPPDAAPASGILSEQDAYERALPVFQRYCANCHTTAGDRSRASTLRHFNMDRYPLTGHHANEIGATVRKVLGASGKRATMPRDRPGAVQGDDLRLVLEWAEAFDRAHPPGHGGHRR
ncbi:MAG: hypothetical protein GMKNLPBB_03105 [Myxococcota bacterium]|nr:hypothetical protein [Myxococcota bacterium]